MFRFFLGSFKKKFCYAISAMLLIHPKIVNQSIRTSVGGLIFFLVRNTYLNASMVLFVGYEYAGIIAPILMLYHIVCRGLLHRLHIVVAHFVCCAQFVVFNVLNHHILAIELLDD